jgi:CDP-diglyceride synthetase
MIIDALPVWILFFVTAAIVVFAVEIGFRLGKMFRHRKPEERESPVSAIAGAILGLLAFMLAFTFSIVSDRYDTKKGLVREEANVLRTTWERSDFLQEPDRAKTKALLREYVDNRIGIAQSGDTEKAGAALGDATRMQHQIWDMAVVNARIDMNSDIGALYIESVNQMSDLHALRVNQGLQARVPSGIWFVLYALLLLGMVGIGYQTAIADSRRSRVTSLLAISFSLVIALIAALDHPMGGFISVSQQPMVSLQMEMKNTPEPAPVKKP